MSQELRKVIEDIVQKLEKLEEVRDNVIKESRDILKLAREAVMSVHKGDLQTAEKLCSQLREKVLRILSELRRREHYEKPSVKRKKKALAARKKRMKQHYIFGA